MPLRRTQAPGSTINWSSQTWKQQRPGDVDNHAVAANTGAGQHDHLLVVVLQEGSSQVLVMATCPWGLAAVWDRSVVVAGPVAPA
ncbi:hypothetical protein MTO96_030326 [Rhipicephalus appendiculatus]